MKRLVASVVIGLASPALGDGYDSPEALGKALFFDANLSANRTESCASCHNPDYGFTDPRETAAGRAVSPGDDGISIGSRNAPTASYAMYSPRFEEIKPGVWRGGEFLDGRVPDLEGQAGGPPLNPVEMGMPDKASVVARLRENPDYVAAFAGLFGDGIWNDTDAAYGAMTRAIAAFERTDTFAPFDSKYDRFLRGEAQLTPEEDMGRVLFFSDQFTNCNICHQLRRSAVAEKETFSNYEYHNIGVPANPALQAANGVSTPDHGLLDNPAVNDPRADGKFKVPTLRNVAVTGPYMHNGVFKDLRTVMKFYNRYNSRDPQMNINPETGKPFGPPEVPDTLSVMELTYGPALDDEKLDALVAFLRTLTDARYEDLIDQ